MKGKRNTDVPLGHVLRQLLIVVLPGLLFPVGACDQLPRGDVEAEAVYDIQQIGASSRTLQRGPGWRNWRHRRWFADTTHRGLVSRNRRPGDVQEPPGSAAAPAARLPPHWLNHQLARRSCRRCHDTGGAD
jgi:hypothetical protein